MFSYNKNMGRDSVSLRVGKSGDRIRVGVRFSEAVLTNPGAHPASCTMGTGNLSGGKVAGALTTHSHVAPRRKIEQSDTSIIPPGLRGLL
jgi:hypothetical protein